MEATNNTTADEDDATSTSNSEQEESTSNSATEEEDEEEEEEAAPEAVAAANLDEDDKTNKCDQTICRELAKVKTDDDLARLLKCKVEALSFVTLVEPLTKCRKDGCPYPAAKCNYSYCVVCADMWYPRIRYEANHNNISKKERGHLLLGEQFSRGAVKQKSYCACGSELCIGIGYTDSLFSFPNTSNTAVLNSWVECLEASSSIDGSGLLPEVKQKILAKPFSYRVAYWHFDPQHLKLVVQENNGDNGSGGGGGSSNSKKWELRRAETYTDASGKIWENCHKYPPPNYDLQKFIDSARASQETDLEERREEGEVPDWVRVMLRAETHPELLYDTPTSAATASSMILAAAVKTSPRKAAAPAGLEVISRHMVKKRKSLGVDYAMLAAASEKEVKRLKRQLYDCKTEKAKQEAEHAAQLQALEEKNSALVHANQVLSERVQEQAAELEQLNSLVASWLPAAGSPLRPSPAQQLHQRRNQQHRSFR